MKILRFLIAVLACAVFLNADNLQKDVAFETKSSVISAFVYENLLFASTDGGSVEIFDLDKRSLAKIINLAPIKSNFSEELANPRVINSDTLDGNRVLILAEDTQAGRALFIYEDGKLEQLFSQKDKLNISKAYFADHDKIVLGTLGNEIKLYDLNKKEFIYSVQPYWSMLTDFIVSFDRSTAFSAAESGVVYLYDISSGKKIQEISLHNDIILSEAAAGDLLLSGGSNKHLRVVNLKSGAKKDIIASFPVYAVGLSPSGKVGAYTSDESGTIIVFDTENLEVIAKLQGSGANKKTNSIIFLSETDIITCSNSREILKWKIK